MHTSSITPSFRHLFPILVGGCLYLSLSGCMSTAPLEVLQPAAFALPSHIDRIATVNRAVPGKKFGNFLEGVVTGEGIGQDQSGRRRAIEGLSDGLTRTPRFEVIFSGLEMEGAGQNFPSPLPWHTVDSICAVTRCDAVAALEKYDSDVSRVTQKRESKRKDKEGNEYIEISYQATMRTQVNLGWRLYDGNSQRILDQFDVYERDETDRTGNSEAQALERLPDIYRAVDQTSYDAGIQYGMRIAPTWITVNRKFFPKAKDAPQMEQAARLARTGQWEEAARIWLPLVENPSTSDKTKGKAAYNMAVASEVLGKLDLALDWTQQAYTRYGLNKARSYGEVIAGRMADQNRLAEQLPE